MAEERAAAAVELAANAAAKNTRHLLAAVGAAAISAVSCLMIAIIALIAHW